MIFEKILINNLFCYYGEHVFDLSGAQEGRNIVLISGRNGHGKTSFINSVKLLFIGVTREMCDTVRVVKRKLGPGQYLLGLSDDSWRGAFNQRAKREGQRKFGIRIHWRDDEGVVEVSRSWTLEGQSPRETLSVVAYPQTASYLSQEGENAQHFLNERLPADFVPFFFFDGEGIQSLAANQREAQKDQTERLLNISPINKLVSAIDTITKEWGKKAMPEAERVTLTLLENALEKLQAELSLCLRQQEDLKEEREKLERMVKQEDHYLDGMRAYSVDRDEARLREKKKEIMGRIEELQEWVASTIPTQAPLLANPSLVQKAVAELQRLVENEAFIQGDVYLRLAQSLPRALFEDPPHPHPPLNPDQSRFLKRRLEILLHAYIPSSEDRSQAPFRLDRSKAKSILKSLRFFSQADPLRRECSDKLSELSKRKRDIKEIEQKLNDVSRLSEEEREEYRRRRAENETRKKQLYNKEQNLEQLRKNEKKKAREIKENEKKIFDQQERVTIHERSRRKVDLGKQLLRFFEEYIGRLKIERRLEIEETLNRHFQALMSSNKLVDHIRLDEGFGLHYEDKEGESIGMGNLSEGMKQLAATALLWALKEVSGKNIPIIIDAPLARLDRGHQENLLRHFYPRVGEQIIVLPTNSELDRGKYSILLPHVYREYQLENPEGDQASIKAEPMYPEESRSHG